MNVRTATSPVLALLAASLFIPPAWSEPAGAVRAPEFPDESATDWINSLPLTLADLRGRPVLIEFWTFDCVNCLRTVPWMRHVAESFRERGLVVVSVHTPEFAHERDPANVRAAVERLGIEYPVMLDNEFQYWHALGNRYWPAFYLLDPDGRIVATAVGEMHVGTGRAQEFERRIAASLESR